MVLGVLKTNNYLQFKIKVQFPSQEPPGYFIAPNHDSKDMYDLCTFKIKKESKDLNQWCINTSDHSQIKMKIPNPSQEHQASFKAPHQDLKDISFAPPKSR